MKKIKVLIFYMLLSSCTEYMGTIEPNYEPSKNVSEILTTNPTLKETDNIDIKKILFPNNKNIDRSNLNFKAISKIDKVDKDTNIFFFDNKIYFSLKKLIYAREINDEKNLFKLKVDLDKGENIIYFYKFKKEIFFITSKSKLFRLNQESYELILNLDLFLTSNPIVLDDKLILFSIFGEVIEINLNTFNFLSKGLFTNEHGVTSDFKYYINNDLLIYLYNSGTLLTLDKFNELKINYYLEDLNILSSNGIFTDLIDTPFMHNNYYYFIDRSGIVSVFNPLTSDVSWETNLSSTLIDYSLSIEGFLILLTFDKIFIYDKNGNLIRMFPHNLDNPITIFGISEIIHIISEDGISSYNINSNNKYDFIKNRFSGHVDIYYNGANIFIKDNKFLYILK